MTAKSPATVPLFALAANILLFALQLHLTDLLVASQHGVSVMPSGSSMSAEQLAHLPYPFVGRRANPSEALHAVNIVLALVQTGLLYMLWRALPPALNVRIVQVGIGISALLMFTLALAAKSLTTTDVYAYVAYAKLGFAQAYSPLSQPFTGDFAVVNKIWGLPVIPCVYGPLWLALQRLFSGLAGSLAQAVLLTRLLGACAVFALCAALSRLKLPGVVYPLVLLNPAILRLYVVDAHNDLIGIVFVVFALAVATAAPLFAALLVACAGLVKISLAALALVVFRAPRPFVSRVSYVAICLVVFAAGSYLLGGMAYVHDIGSQMKTINVGQGHHPSVIFVHMLEVLAVVVLVLAFVRGTLVRSGCWSLFTISGGSYPWYFIWGLPYAALSTTGIVQFLVLLPLVAAMVDSIYRNLYYETFAMAALVVYIVYDLFRLRSASMPKNVAKLKMSDS